MLSTGSPANIRLHLQIKHLQLYEFLDVQLMGWCTSAAFLNICDNIRTKASVCDTLHTFDPFRFGFMLQFMKHTKGFYMT